MTLLTRLRTLADALPPQGAVTLTRDDLVQLLDEEGGASGGASASAPDSFADLTVEQLATRLGRSPSTVRTWLGEGRLSGAYRLRGREWRIPPAALRAFLDREARGEVSASEQRQSQVDLGAWRRHLSSPPSSRKAGTR